MEIYLVIQKLMEMNEKGDWNTKDEKALFAFQDKSMAQHWCKEQNKESNTNMEKLVETLKVRQYYKWNYVVKPIQIY